jgi:prepilin-type N-terminal cleavage/methylation domain-containing protein
VTGRRGFTLLEVMIAASIAAIGIVSLLELFSGSIHLATMATRQTAAINVASSVLDHVLWRADFDDGEQSGHVDDFDWTVSIESIDPEFGPQDDGLGKQDNTSDPYDLKRISVTVSWPTPGGGKSVTVTTARLIEHF